MFERLKLACYRRYRKKAYEAAIQVRNLKKGFSDTEHKFAILHNPDRYTLTDRQKELKVEAWKILTYLDEVEEIHSYLWNKVREMREKLRKKGVLEKTIA